MLLGIHHRKDGGFSERWVKYCQDNNVPFKIVNCYSDSIIKDLEDCGALMWHHDHAGSKDKLFAKSLLFSIEQSGKFVFPDFNTAWHFDDKVGQKYLLEALVTDMVPSYVFYSKVDAMKWANSTSFPKVFKLRGGAGSSNVKLARTKSDAINLINKAFGSGFKQYNGWANLQERWRKYRIGKTDLKDIAKGVIRLVKPPDFSKILGREIGYAYFQDFIPNNDHDIRVVVIDGKAFAIKRMTRENDFRASGSGHILYEKSLFDEILIQKSFVLAKKLNSQCMAVDYVFLNNEPKIVEISYGFSIVGYDPCEGYWDESMKWHSGSFNACGWMIELVLKSIKK